ncbi:MAG: sporulation protein YqfD [Oscillospiraceae bacterium]|jgi:similar to stage IV sporulation protein|nr:sporulation protein YqfD [Oscillospiraceae bacterium]
MRQRAINLARGVVRVEVMCRYPERFINLCASNNIEFWGMERADTGEVRAYFHTGGFKRLRELSAKHGFEVTRISRAGAPSLFGKLRKRYVLIAGVLLFVLATRALSLFVWDIRVLGNENVPSSLILENLKSLGFSYGTFGPGVKSEQLANKLILALPELSWFAVNISGCRADVLVRERTPRPEIIDVDAPAMVRAAKSGVITKISVLEGASAVTVGDTVQTGDLLVSGILDTRRGARRTAHALAEIEARTWYELSAEMTVETVVKRFTGEKKRRHSIIIAGKKINLYFNSSISWSDYDKIITEKFPPLPGGASLPIKLVTESFDKYEPVTTEQSRERVERTLREGLTARLREAVGDGEVRAVSWDVFEKNGVITVTLNAECSEQIAVSAPFTAQERASAGIQ